MLLKHYQRLKNNYDVVDKEGLTIGISMKHFWPHIHGSQFTIEIDHFTKGTKDHPRLD